MNDECENKVFGSLIHALGRFITEITSLRTSSGPSTHGMNSESNASHAYNSNYDGRQWSSKRFENSKFFTFLKSKNAHSSSSKIQYPMGTSSRDSGQQGPPPGADDKQLQIALTVDCFVSFVEALGVVCNVSDQSESSSSPRQVEEKLDDRDPTLPLSVPISPIGDGSGSGFSSSSFSNVPFDIKHMIEVIWRPLQAALSHMLNYSMFETQYQQLLSIYCTMCRISGKIELQTPLQSFLKSMSSHALPNPFSKMTFSDILVKVGNSLINNIDIGGNNVNAPATDHGSKSMNKSGKLGGNASSTSGGLSPLPGAKSLSDGMYCIYMCFVWLWNSGFSIRFDCCFVFVLSFCGFVVLSIVR